jgi:Tol biopolymer transport system component
MTSQHKPHLVPNQLLIISAVFTALFMPACAADSKADTESQPKPTPELQAAILQPLNTADTLLFDSDRTGNFEIYLHKSGKNLTQLTKDTRYDSWWPRLSPNGKQVLFYRTPKGVHDTDYSKASLWLMQIDGEQIVELRPKGTDGWAQQGHAEWSPDGQQLVMFGGGRLSPQIFVTDAKGQSARQLTKRAGVNLDPAWSPDGSSIVFVGCPSAICFEGGYEIYTMSVANPDKAKRISKDSLRDHDPYYSPDGQKIAWLTQTSSKGIVGEWNIQLADLNGKNQKWLTKDNNINSKPAWSKDGKFIYFHKLILKPNERFQIWRIQADGTQMQEISGAHPGNNEYPTQ